MKPIKLKIKGLNSFIEEQEIDFLKLTDRGLFGIFGPTGSGKSSILDGITLALYGEVARKSSNYINMNCDKLNVHYEFQISGKENKVYAVDREFKRDKKSGNPVSGKCKICDITNDEPEILAEKVKDVTNKCKEVIGLSLEDFTRTVVLPQGKFSEFLKLEGRSRREMLERLFNLGMYGDDLSNKLSHEIYKARNEENVLKGELNGYEDISVEGLKKQKEDLKELKTNYDSELKSYDNLNKKYNEGKEIWQLQNELTDYETKLNNLLQNEGEIKLKKDKIDNYTRSSKILPAINEYDKTLNSLKASKDKEPLLKEELDSIKINKTKIEDDYKNTQFEINSKVPELKVREKDIEDAIELKKKLEQINMEIKKCYDAKLKLESIKKLKEEKKAEASINIEKLTVSVSSKEKEIEDKSINYELKEKVQKGYELEKSIKDYNTRLKGINDKISASKDRISKYEKEVSDSRTVLKEKEDNLKNLNSKYGEVNSNKISQSELLNMQQQLSVIKDKYDKYNKFLDNIKNNKLSLEECNKEKEGLIIKITNTQNLINDLKEKKKISEIEVVSEKLRKELLEGKPCPVCGSIHHDISNVNVSLDEDIAKITEKLEEKENKLKVLNSKEALNNINIANKIEDIKDNENSIIELGEDFKQFTVEELEEKFKSTVSKAKQNEEAKEVLEKQINSLKDEIASINSMLVKNKAVIDESNNMLISLNKEKDDIDCLLNKGINEIDSLKESTDILNFTEKNNEISKTESYLQNLNSILREERIKLEELTKEFNNLNVEITTISERITNGTNIIKEKEDVKAERELEIKKKAGSINDLELKRDDIIKSIKEIEDNYNKLENYKKEVNDKYDKFNESYITLVSSINDLINRESQEKNNIYNLLLEEGFKSIEECKTYDLSKEDYNAIKDDIDIFNSSLLKNKGAIESIKVKINNRSISKEDYEELENQKNELEIKIKQVNEDIIKKQEEVIKTEERIKELDTLIDKKGKLEHKIAVLNDLDKLFRGKKFVEFVAIDRLKYISREASKRLKEITNGNYGLEVDDNSKFVIRDYKNGGVERDASTLSGGEIFLASLALALALSSEIQLKGTAPLELFFLDEGFGTLDDNLLDVVMSSLERIHNDKLKVGIISHVESIKNRVPVKLIITPAESGVSGSRVRIERS